MRHGRAWALAALVLGGALLSAKLGASADAIAVTGARSPLLRVLGPLADLGADVEWIRYQRALFAGRHQAALAHAERALTLAPERTTGWRLLASHLGLYLASAEREPDPARRAAWVRAALAALDRGEGLADEPAELALLGGLILLTHAESEAGLPWPGGGPGLWSDIAAAGERAAREGSAAGTNLAAYAREHGAGTRLPAPGLEPMQGLPTGGEEPIRER